MRRLIPLLAGLAAATLAAPVTAAAEPALSAAEDAQLQHNLALGALLYRYDQSAWHVTDAMLAALPEAARPRIRGYVTTAAPNGLRTTFFGEGGMGYQRLYSAVWTGSAIADAWQFKTGGESTLTEAELRLVDARKVALAAAGQLAMCNDARPNMIVVPEPNDSIVHVYVMTPQTKDGVYPLGGHHRIDVRDGKVVAQRDFTRTCVTFDKSSVPAGGKPQAAFITHLLDPVPTEMHAFTVMAMQLPLYVGVKDGRIYEVGLKDGQPTARLVQAKK